jgi:hypothetical protein
MKQTILLILLTLISAWVKVDAQGEPFDPIVKAIQGSDSRGLAAYFNPTVELLLPDNENTYSSSQGEMIMKDFFRKYPPDSFTVIQKGTIDPASSFAIGNYATGSRQFQVCINLHKESNRFLIQKIKFEEKKK